jgi:sirohydrochlorin ferrochelatase
MPAGPLTLLVDNGSLEPAATLALRELAAQLTRRLGQIVEPVSLLHSSGIDPELLDGQPAEILFPALEKRLAAGRNEFVILPLFFGPSQALTVYLPENLARLRAKFPSARFRLAPPLHDARDGRLARALADRVLAELDAATRGTDSPASKEPAASTVRVALVDHGSPVAAVTAVRDDLARQLTRLLGSRVAAVAPCSMERRPEPAYDFNEPLLEGLLATPPWSESVVIVAMQFLLPGRHAGPAGDVAEICRQAKAAHPRLRTRMTGLLGSHPLVLEILADRSRSALPVSGD